MKIIKYKKEENLVIFQIINENKSILEFKENGDIFVKGKLVENDKEVVDGFREFLKGQSLIN